ncbi:cation-transporting P-type ATPase [Methyloglobulus sp.]|uniref:cation-transporting P-type ATPase n=1 Tax=Methyloglobulus sp. TaxID=2518622 RepID=UPI00398A3D5B
MSPEATCEAFTSTKQGLSQQEIKQRLNKSRFNRLHQQPAEALSNASSATS